MKLLYKHLRYMRVEVGRSHKDEMNIFGGFRPRNLVQKAQRVSCRLRVYSLLSATLYDVTEQELWHSSSTLFLPPRSRANGSPWLSAS